MASVKEIREGLLFISWDAKALPSGPHYRCNNGAGPSIELNRTPVNVSTLADAVDTFILICKMEGQQIVLEIESPVARKQMKQFELETVQIHATKDRIQKKMTLNQSKWTATWDVFPNYGCQRCTKQIRCISCGRESREYPLGFDILIDLTPDSVISVKKGSKHVLDHLLNLWNTKTLSDVTFNCQGKSIKAHTLILASGSSVLAAMFQHNFKENQEKMVEIKDINLEVFEALLCYIYTGNIYSRRNVDVAELFVAADKYAVETLKEECALILSRKLKVENAAQCLVLAHLVNSPKLREASLNFISKNAKAICSRKDWMEITKNYPELSFQATQLIIGLL
jgi:hypothetical protein